MKKRKSRTIKAPRQYNPPGPAPIEHLAYLSKPEMGLLRRMTDGKANRGPGGLLSFADDSASSMGVSRGDPSQATKGSTGSGASSTGTSGGVSGGGLNSGGAGGGGLAANFGQSMNPTSPGYGSNLPGSFGVPNAGPSQLSRDVDAALAAGWGKMRAQQAALAGTTYAGVQPGLSSPSVDKLTGFLRAHDPAIPGAALQSLNQTAPLASLGRPAVVQPGNPMVGTDATVGQALARLGYNRVGQKVVDPSQIGITPRAPTGLASGTSQYAAADADLQAQKAAMAAAKVSSPFRGSIIPGGTLAAVPGSQLTSALGLDPALDYKAQLEGLPYVGAAMKSPSINASLAASAPPAPKQFTDRVTGAMTGLLSGVQPGLASPPMPPGSTRPGSVLGANAAPANMAPPSGFASPFPPAQKQSFGYVSPEEIARGTALPSLSDLNNQAWGDVLPAPEMPRAPLAYNTPTDIALARQFYDMNPGEQVVPTGADPEQSDLQAGIESAFTGLFDKIGNVVNSGDADRLANASRMNEARVQRATGNRDASGSYGGQFAGGGDLNRLALDDDERRALRDEWKSQTAGGSPPPAPTEEQISDPSWSGVSEDGKWKWDDATEKWTGRTGRGRTDDTAAMPISPFPKGYVAPNGLMWTGKAWVFPASGSVAFPNYQQMWAFGPPVVR